MPFYGFHDQIQILNTTKRSVISIVVFTQNIALVVSLDSYLIGISSSKVIRLLLQYTMLNKGLLAWDNSPIVIGFL
jgi:hypothetical protein